MNISFFLHPKSDVAYLYEDDSIRQGLEKMKHYGYSAIPVLSKDNQYVGTISEGDFLWSVCNFEKKEIKEKEPQSLEHLRISDLSFRRKYPSAKIDTSMEELVEKVMNQNFVPVVDDRNIFIGIVTRRDIMQYFVGLNGHEESRLSRVI